MKRIGLLIGFLAVLVFLLPLSGQDVKKDVDKKETDKKEDKKDPDKKDEKKKPPEKLVYGAKFVTKILGQKGDTNREYTVEVHEIDPKKVYDFNLWKTQQSTALAKQQFQIGQISPKDVQGRINAQINYQKAVAQFQADMARRSTQLTSNKNMEVRAHENAKVRAMVPPIEFDDQGFQKKFTKKELDERRDKTGLPGFPSDFDAIKQGQMVEIYMAKVTPAKKDDTKKKKGPADDDPPAMTQTNEFVLMVILPEGK